MLFEWDENKNKINRKKHGISFELACLLFRDPLTLSELDDRFNDQHHWRSIGQIDNKWFVAAHTQRKTNYGEEIIRIISAREATARERQRYQDNR
jgi:uncharacterized protein